LHTAVIPTLRGLKQDDLEFKANLGYIARPCFIKVGWGRVERHMKSNCLWNLCIFSRMKASALKRHLCVRQGWQRKTI
jgi:hypothetical protein